MLTTGERPRELRWYHAGPMLFGDWGTSRLYVLGLAFAFTYRASFWYVAAMCLLMIGVGWSYEIICRLFPDGGGVYSSAQRRSQLLAVVGGLLLCADYVVTASLSCLDAFHYLGINGFYLSIRGIGTSGGIPLDALAATLTILAIGWLNYFGPTKTGTIAMFVALATVVLTLVIGVACLPHLGEAFARVESPFKHGVARSWIGFTEIVLALSGVEAIANMTGIMVQPVEKTARKAILPVLIEIVILNLILALAMTSLPDEILFEKLPNGDLAHTGDMLKQIASHYISPGFAAVASVVFAALLLSAVNTAIGALVSTQFMLSRDKELPKALAKLNRFGMPKIPLVVAAVIPALVVVLFPDVEKLAGLYAIGVVGAISITLASTSTNRQLELKTFERAFMLGLTAIMLAIGLTITLEKPAARSFALIVLVTGLAGRLVTIVSNKVVPIERSTRIGYMAFAASAVAAELGIALIMGDDWRAFIPSSIVALIMGYASYETQKYRAILLAPPEAPTLEAAPAKPRMILKGEYSPKERIMVATTGNPRLIDFAIKECKNRQAELDILFIRHLAVTPMGSTAPPTLAEDSDALDLFDRLRAQSQENGVPLRLLYGVARDIPEAILDMAVTHGADLLLLGTTRRGTLWKAMKGDVIQAVAEQLPERIGLLIHA
ncbi:universal stress protein [Tundrisphaera lichenicola]|uniref:universal stress protein n=1 Tax=Tundrisphaera lichenicola TaxID=2029860 RepID=UPI003EBBF45E